MPLLAPVTMAMRLVRGLSTSVHLPAGRGLGRATLGWTIQRPRPVRADASATGLSTVQSLTLPRSELGVKSIVTRWSRAASPWPIPSTWPNTPATDDMAAVPCRSATARTTLNLAADDVNRGFATAGPWLPSGAGWGARGLTLSLGRVTAIAGSSAIAMSGDGLVASSHRIVCSGAPELTAVERALRLVWSAEHKRSASGCDLALVNQFPEPRIPGC